MATGGVEDERAHQRRTPEPGHRADRSRAADPGPPAQPGPTTQPSPWPTGPSDLAPWARDPFEDASPTQIIAPRVVGLVALVVSVAYLTWRVGWTLPIDGHWLALPFLALEVHATIGVALFTIGLWDPRSPRFHWPRARTAASVDVLIPTYGEPLDVLLPVVAKARRMLLVDRVWVLDDARRPEVAELARELGATYLTRPANTHAKAGNLNHALAHVTADFVVVLDADHVPRTDFVARTIGYFDDPTTALVQTPQDFYNRGSFEHIDDTRHEETLFYRVIQPAKNRWNAAFWCGTNAIVRTEALRQVGGVATDSVTEDIQTTIRLHRRGWRTVYHNEVLARGLAARNSTDFLTQRRRWATGAMQVLRQEHPLVGRGLSVPQRLAYAFTLLGWFDAWRILGYLLVPIAVLTTGALPVAAPLAVFAPVFAAVLLTQQAAIHLLARGHAHLGFATVFDILRLPAALTATVVGLSPRPLPFRVTPKGRDAGRRSRLAAVPPLLSLLAAAHLAAGVWFLATLAGRTPTTYDERFAMVLTFGWLLLNACFLAAATGRAAASRFAHERRSGARFAVQLPVTCNGRAATVVDASVTGLGIEISDVTVAPGQEVTVRLALPHAHVTARCVIRRVRALESGAFAMGVEFLPGQLRAQADVAVHLFDRDHGEPLEPATITGVSPDTSPLGRPAPPTPVGLPDPVLVIGEDAPGTGELEPLPDGPRPPAVGLPARPGV